ncbi:hypothetical protein HDU97_002125 [Phlyctochytrium planicorne]|nr:hypothetical protein HDU97_002125 [Phlyctochytrium planicorne]
MSMQTSPTLQVNQTSARVSLDDQDLILRSGSTSLGGLGRSGSGSNRSMQSPTPSFRSVSTSMPVDLSDQFVERPSGSLDSWPKAEVDGPVPLSSRSFTVPRSLGQQREVNQNDISNEDAKGDRKGVRSSMTLGLGTDAILPPGGVHTQNIFQSFLPNYPVMAMGVPAPDLPSFGPPSQSGQDLDPSSKKRFSVITTPSTTPIAANNTQSASGTLSKSSGTTGTLSKKRKESAVFNTSATDKENAEFHRLFRSLSATDRLIDDFPCALRKETTIRGRLWVSQHHLAFSSSNPFAPTVLIPLAQVIDVQKKNVALLIPNAIEIEVANLYQDAPNDVPPAAANENTSYVSASSSSVASSNSTASSPALSKLNDPVVISTSKVFFSSFFDRDGVFELINKLWDLHVDRSSLRRKFPDISGLRCTCGNQGTCETCQLRHQIVNQRRKDAFPIFFNNNNSNSNNNNTQTTSTSSSGDGSPSSEKSNSILRRRSTLKKKTTTSNSVGQLQTPSPNSSRQVSPNTATGTSQQHPNLPVLEVIPLERVPSFSSAVTAQTSVDPIPEDKVAKPAWTIVNGAASTGHAAAQEIIIMQRNPSLSGVASAAQNAIEITPPAMARTQSVANTKEVTPWELEPAPLSPPAIAITPSVASARETKEQEKARKEREKEEKRSKKEAEKEEKKQRKLAEKAEKAEQSSSGYVSAGGSKRNALKKWMDNRNADHIPADRSTPTPPPTSANAEDHEAITAPASVQEKKEFVASPTPATPTNPTPASPALQADPKPQKSPEPVISSPLKDSPIQEATKSPASPQKVPETPVVRKVPKKKRAVPPTCGCRGDKKAAVVPAGLTSHPIEDKHYPLSFQSMVDHVYSLKSDVGGGSFLVKYLIEKRKVMNLAIGQWKPPNVPDSGPIAADKILKRGSGDEIENLDVNFDKMGPGWHRVIEYTLPLSIPLGPKSTRCIITEEIISMKKGKYLCIRSKTKNPDIFDGFQVIARFCLVWNGPRKTRHIVEAAVEFWKFTVIKVPIMNGAIDGVRGNCTALIAALNESLKQWPEPTITTDDEYEEDLDAVLPLTPPLSPIHRSHSKRSSRTDMPLAAPIPLRSDGGEEGVGLHRTGSRGSSGVSRRNSRNVSSEGTHAIEAPKRRNTSDSHTEQADTTSEATALSKAPQHQRPQAAGWAQLFTLFIVVSAIMLMGFNTMAVWQLASATERLGRGLGSMGQRLGELEKEAAALRVTVDILKGFMTGPMRQAVPATPNPAVAGDENDRIRQILSDPEVLAKAILAAAASMKNDHTKLTHVDKKARATREAAARAHELAHEALDEPATNTIHIAGTQFEFKGTTDPTRLQNAFGGNHNFQDPQQRRQQKIQEPMDKANRLAERILESEYSPQGFTKVYGIKSGWATSPAAVC